jgi:release factor glutamine methyltransferase
MFSEQLAGWLNNLAIMPPSLLSDITDRLYSLSDTPALDASVLLAHIVDKPRTWVIAHPELRLTNRQKRQLDGSLTRLERGESFPYVLGHWEFFGLDFEITPNVLIPRPETELLVERAISRLKEAPVLRSVADIGTGSGAIAVSIAAHVLDTKIIATDLSAEALEVAKRNAKKFGVENRIEFFQCDLLPPTSELFTTKQPLDLLCANLPYIPTEILHSLPIYGREPTLALDGGKDGLDLIRRLMHIAPAWLAPKGMILLEVESTRGMQAVHLARDLFSEATIHLHRDLGGQDRLLEIRFSV